jgi:hypothetical protein
LATAIAENAFGQPVKNAAVGDRLDHFSFGGAILPRQRAAESRGTSSRLPRRSRAAVICTSSSAPMRCASSTGQD